DLASGTTTLPLHFSSDFGNHCRYRLRTVSLHLRCDRWCRAGDFDIRCLAGFACETKNVFWAQSLKAFAVDALACTHSTRPHCGEILASTSAFPKTIGE